MTQQRPYLQVLGSIRCGTLLRRLAGIDELTKRAGCVQTNKVLPIRGNHDVDHEVITPYVRKEHQQLRAAKPLKTLRST